MFQFFRKGRRPFSESSSDRIREQYECVSAYTSAFQLSESLPVRQGIASARVRGPIGLGASRRACTAALGKPQQRIERINPITDAIHIYRYRSGNYRYRDELHFSMDRLFYFARLYYLSTERDLKYVMTTIAEQYLGCAGLEGAREKIVDPDGNDILVTASLPALHLQYLGRSMETIERLRSMIHDNAAGDSDRSVELMR
jgi:hypothetical protein